MAPSHTRILRGLSWPNSPRSLAATTEPTATTEPVSQLPVTGGHAPVGSAAGTMLPLALLGACALLIVASIRRWNRPATWNRLP
jgi:hypothetical protein